MLRFQEFLASLVAAVCFCVTSLPKWTEIERTRCCSLSTWDRVTPQSIHQSVFREYDCRVIEGWQIPVQSIVKIPFSPDASVSSFMFACWQSFAYLHAGILFSHLPQFQLEPCFTLFRASLAFTTCSSSAFLQWEAQLRKSFCKQSLNDKFLKCSNWQGYLWQSQFCTECWDLRQCLLRLAL